MSHTKSGHDGGEAAETGAIGQQVACGLHNMIASTLCMFELAFIDLCISIGALYY